MMMILIKNDDLIMFILDKVSKSLSDLCGELDLLCRPSQLGPYNVGQR